MTAGPVTGTVHDDLLARRADYPVLATTTYLASHTLGAMHRRTPERLAEFAGLWAERGDVAWGTWAPEVERVADLVGSLVGAPPGTTVLRQNVADLLGDLVVSLDWTGRRNRGCRGGRGTITRCGSTFACRTTSSPSAGHGACARDSIS